MSLYGTPIHYLVIENRMFDVEVTVNGFVVHRESADTVTRSTVPINPYLRLGHNELELRVTEHCLGPLLNDEDRLVAQGIRPLHAAALWARGVKGEMAGDDDTFFAELRYLPQKEEKVSLPVVLRATAMVDDVPGLSDVDAADALDTSNEAAQTTLIAYLQTLHDAATRRDIDALAAEMKHVNRALAAAYGDDEAQMASLFRQGLKLSMDELDFSIAPLEPASVRLRPVFGGRAVIFEDAHHRSPLRQGATGPSWGMRPAVALYHGVPRIVR